MKYSVCITIPVRVRVDGITAESPEAACNAAYDHAMKSGVLDSTFYSDYMDAGAPLARYTEVADDEAALCALVDECDPEYGSDDFNNSKWYFPCGEGWSTEEERHAN